MESNLNNININELRALCHILDEFEVFVNNTNNFLEDKRNESSVFYELVNLINGKFVMAPHRVLKFYNDNKDILEKINKYGSVPRIINYRNSNIRYYYEYLLKNKDRINQILILLDKLQMLGFAKITLDDEPYKEQSAINKKTYGGQEIIYYNNMYALPSYDKDIVKYATNNSEYKIEMYITTDHNITSKSISLSSLTFDPSILPNSISKKDIYDRIVRLSDNEKDNVLLRDSIDLNMGIYDLKRQYENTLATIQSLNNIKDKEELINILKEIRKNIDKLYSKSKDFDRSIIDEGKISKTTLDSEKLLYLRKRESYNNLDI